MRRFLDFSLVLLLALAVIGCGGSRQELLKTRGRLLKSGQPFIPSEGEAVQMLFVPILPEGVPVQNFYAAIVDQATGTFTAAGARLEGVPPGKYKVAVELMKKKKDQFGGKYGVENTPFRVDVDASTKEIVIDLDKPGT